jgi:hypothetical protein
MLSKEQFFGMYIGQRVSIPLHYTGRPEAVLIGIKRSNEYVYESDYVCTIINEDACNMGIPIDDCKLMLRPFSDMNKEEGINLFKNDRSDVTDVNYDNTLKCFWVDDHNARNGMIYNPLKVRVSTLRVNQVEYLISIGIDIFNLKEKDWAVYESEVSNEKSS